MKGINATQYINVYHTCLVLATLQRLKIQLSTDLQYFLIHFTKRNSIFLLQITRNISSRSFWSHCTHVFHQYTSSFPEQVTLKSRHIHWRNNMTEDTMLYYEKLIRMIEFMIKTWTNICWRVHKNHLKSQGNKFSHPTGWYLSWF